MRLEKINFSLEKNVELALYEYGTTAENQLSYPNMVGFFGRNGAGKTRALQAVYNTIENAIEENCTSFLDEIPLNAKSKLLRLNTAEILEIRNGKSDALRIRTEAELFNEKKIDSMGIQEYLIKYGKCLLRFIGAQWHEKQNLPADGPIRFFYEMFSKVFEGELRTVYDPTDNGVNLQMNALDIETYPLSEGEWIAVFYLLLFTLANCTKGRYSDAIVIIDELENHLNPVMIREICRGLCSSFGEKGQVWIASHSLDVLLNIDSRNVFRLEKNIAAKKTVIYKTSREINEIIRNELYGDAETALEALQLREDELYSYFVDFMTQSLQEPGVVTCINKNDVQLKLFLKCLNANKSNRVLSMLDFGAGTGRIGDALQQFAIKLDYYGYEPDEDKVLEIKRKGYAKGAYSKKEEIKKKFDIILLCNVLHEIEPWNWKDELTFIKQKLKKDGTLVFIEDLELPVGEYIGECGFLLLDGGMAQSLFGKQNVSIIKDTQKKYRDRILCAVIGNGFDISEEGIVETLELLKTRNIQKVWQIRRMGKDEFKVSQRMLGTSMARACQLAVNADIAIKFLRGGALVSQETIQEFVACFVDVLSATDKKVYLDKAILTEALNEICCELTKETSEYWCVTGSSTLTGSLIERFNNILEKVGLKMSSVGFQRFIQQYICLNIAEGIEEDGFRSLITELVFLDLQKKFFGEEGAQRPKNPN